MTMPSRPIALLYGAVAADAPADEQDTLIEVETVARALKSLGYRIRHVPVTLNLEAARWQLQQLRPALVFNLVETVAGNGRYIHLAPALLEELGLPYTGATLDAMFVTSNKLLAKQWLQRAGLPTAPWRLPDKATWRHHNGGPWLVKSVWEHASIGLHDDSLVYSEPALARKFAGQSAGLRGDWFAERYIEGREFNVSLIAGENPALEVLPIAEIRFQNFPPGKPRIVNYAAKWQADSFEYQHTPRCFEFAAADQALLAELRQLALCCAEVFELRGYARVDFRVDQAGRPWILEVNANPCLAPDAGFPAAAAQAGMNSMQVIERILAAALSTDSAPARYAEPAADERFDPVDGGIAA